MKFYDIKYLFSLFDQVKLLMASDVSKSYWEFSIDDSVTDVFIQIAGSSQTIITGYSFYQILPGRTGMYHTPTNLMYMI